MMGARGLITALLFATLACEAVPDLTYPDAAASEAGVDSGDAQSSADAQDAADDATDVGCSAANVTCKNDHECCSGNCTGTGGHKACAP